MLLPLFFRFVQRKEKHENALNRRIIYYDDIIIWKRKKVSCETKER